MTAVPDTDGLYFQHSPSNRMQTHCASEVLCFRARKSFGESVGGLFVGWAVN